MPNLLIDCFFYSFYMQKKDVLRYTPRRGVVEFVPTQKRYLLIKPMHMQRERDSKPNLLRSRSRIHSLDLLDDKSPTTPDKNSEESHTKAS
jgi:hypothetical protein